MKIVIIVIAVVFLIGGVMGLVKGIFPQLEWLSFRSLLGAGIAEYTAPVYLAERVYGIVMAVLEVLVALLLLISPIRYSQWALPVVSINALGCAVAVALGDLFAIFSLLVRLTVIILLVCAVRRGKAINRQNTRTMEDVKQ